LEEGLEVLISNPVKFKKENPSNGWGNYEQFIEFVTEYLESCKKISKCFN